MLNNQILRKDYSFKRIKRKLIMLTASKLPMLKGETRALLFSFAGVRFENPKSNFIGYDVYFDDLHPELISVGRNTIITSGTMVLSHFLDLSYDDFDHQYIGEVKIGSNVFIGMNTVIVKPIEIENGAIIGANSVINKNIPAYTIWGGNPANFIMDREIKNNDN